MHTRNAWKMLAAAAIALPTLAQAHTGIESAFGLQHGMAHPFTGADHLLAMVAVGLWASQLGGRALWLVPGAFIGMMAAGAGLAVAGVAFPFVEQGITLSVFALGLLVAAAARLPVAACIGLVGTFALFHGAAHGGEMPVAASGLAYGIGFLAATAALHLSGVGIATALRRSKGEAVRLAGAAVAGAGALLALG
jgi:urease accessory protein